MVILMSHGHHHKIRSDNLKIAILLNLGFSIFEFVFGSIINSRMILADALHDAGDAVVLLSMFVVDFFSKKKSTPKYNYGFRRLAVVGALAAAVLILVGSYQLARYVYFEFTRPHVHPYVKIEGLLIVSTIGVVVNLFSALKLRKSKGVLDRAAFTHMLEDLFGWLITLLSSILIWMTGWHAIDRVMSLIMLIIVCWNAVEIIIKSTKILLNSAPSVKDFDKIKREISALKGVKKIENAHFWSLDGEQNVFTARIFVDEVADVVALRKGISKIVAEYGVVDSTVEVLN